MKYKDGVFVEVVIIKDGKRKRVRMTPEAETAQLVANALSKEISKKEIVITSVLDGKHMSSSKHYEGNAFDMRKWIYTDEELKTLIYHLRDTLGEDYDVVEEETHIHVEFDPK